MKKNRNIWRRVKVFSALTILLGSVGISSCNKEFANKLPEPYENDTLNINDGSKRVLYIILDGVKGNVVESIAPETLTLLTDRSIFTYDGLADDHRNQISLPTAWTNMMTGLDYTVSGVTGSDFSGFNNETSPSIFTRVKSEKKNVQTASFSTSAAFTDHLAIDATKKQTFANDVEVKNATIQELSSGTSSLVVAHLHAAELAANNDYTVENEAYVSAIHTIDQQIKEIMNALVNRSTFAKENWLVVVSSSKGGGVSGGASGSNIFDDPSRNAYIAFYNPKFNPQEFSKPDVSALPYVGTTPKYVGANNNATMDDPNVGNFGSDQNATIRFNIRWDYGGTYYPSFLTKRAAFNPGVVGWTFFNEGPTFGLNFSQTGQGNTQRLHTRAIADGKWHNITAVFYKEGNTRYVKVFCDGIPAPAGPLNITNVGNINTTSPLRLGSIGDANVNCMINDLAIYNVALPDAEVIAKSRVTPLTAENDPYHDNLVGYWPANEVTTDNKLYDITGKSAPFSLKGSINWTSFADISPNISPAISPAAFRAVPNTVDIPTMIYSWMNITVPQQWGLMGKYYVPSINLPRD
ncbi:MULTISPECIES: LamG-like jellyroll fold domain-containing protein [Sphingobacterium]|uniref:LamG-like jellyroll fold domain-containing protein n=1 Tax=Sphingobacterium tenebrionis TaxID=3111775 RepID=A0ABU8I6X5_9SPHI|nr:MULTISPECIES: LamG-like jellyroll fold domain-containing protein [unclassified Sphingobacterium]QBR12853.1 DUF4983 domain-containing protein [Sphingobacterium sp. CZ-2]